MHQTEVMRHEGGYTPFEAQISEHVVAGASARITLVVDNTLNFQSVPPGVVEQTPDGPRQRYWHDFFNYAGLHRNVWLACTPTTYIDDITVTTGLSGRTGTVDYRIAVAGRPAVEAAGVRVVLRDADGGEVADGDGSSRTLSLPDVHRWAPGDGYLYDLEVTLVRDGDVQRRYPAGARTSHSRVDRPGQESSERGVVEHRQRTGKSDRGGGELLPAIV